MKPGRSNMLKLVTADTAPTLRRPAHEITLRLTADEFAILSQLARNQDTTREGAVVWMLEAAGKLLLAGDDE